MEQTLNQTLRGGTLKDFQIIKKLGEGSFSQVFLCKRLTDDKQYAMKRVKMQLLQDKEQENALNEVRILASIQSEYVAAYNEAFIDNNNLYVILEYCKFGDIQRNISESFINVFMENYNINILKGLKCLHSLNILHRDIKCANIFISEDGTYKLGDLNVSKIAKNGMVFTQTGTPYYAAPEIWRDEPYDSKCDIWSLGCVIYEMCSLKPPFKAMSMDELYRKVQKGQFDRIPNKYSDELFRVLCMCLKVNPSYRPSAEELLDLPLMGRHFKDNQMDQPEAQNKQQERQHLLATIKCPKNLGLLIGKLPKANYSKPKILQVSHVAEDLYHIKKPAITDQAIEESSVLQEMSNTKKERIRLMSAGQRRNPHLRPQPQKHPIPPQQKPIPSPKNPSNVYNKKPPLIQRIYDPSPKNLSNNPSKIIEQSPITRKPQKLQPLIPLKAALPKLQRPQSHKNIQNKQINKEYQYMYENDKLNKLCEKYLNNDKKKQRPFSAQYGLKKNINLKLKQELIEQYEKYKEKQQNKEGKPGYINHQYYQGK